MDKHNGGRPERRRNANCTLKCFQTIKASLLRFPEALNAFASRLSTSGNKGLRHQLRSMVLTGTKQGYGPITLTALTTQTNIIASPEKPSQSTSRTTRFGKCAGMETLMPIRSRFLKTTPDLCMTGALDGSQRSAVYRMIGTLCFRARAARSVAEKTFLLVTVFMRLITSSALTVISSDLKRLMQSSRHVRRYGPSLISISPLMPFQGLRDTSFFLELSLN